MKLVLALCGLLVPVFAATASTAQAQAQSSWQVSAVVSNSPGLATFDLVTAVSPSDAWAAGQGGTTGNGAQIAQWNGSSWQSVPPPTPTTSEFTALGMSSPTDVWAVVSNSGEVLHWDGHSWAKFSFHQNMLPGGLAVLSPTDVWVLGEGEVGAFAENYNGHRWRSYPSPVVPDAVSTVSARDIWTVGITLATYGLSNDAYKSALANWNGKSWQPVPLPNEHLGKDETVQTMGIAALSRTDVWVDGEVIRGFTEQQVRSVLLHWNGKRWHVYDSPVNELAGIAADGHGGFWLTADPQIPGRADLVHFAYGGWHITAAPLPAGQPDDNVTLNDIVLVPHTTQLWAVGNVDQPGSLPSGIIESFGLQE